MLYIPISLIGIFASCENSIEKVKLVTSHEVLPVQSMRDAEFTYSDSAEIKFKVITPLLHRYIGEGEDPEPYDVFPEGVKVISYNDQMEPESQITANYAISYSKKGLMEAENDVVVINSEGKKLNTEHLVWNEAEGKIFSDKFVKITTPEEIIFGDGLEANQDFSEYRIKNIKGRIKINEAEDGKVQ